MTGRRAQSTVLVLVVLFGAALRLFPIWFGLPYPHARPDEETTLGHAAAILAGDPNPHFFNWPSLTFYVIAGLFGIASAITGAGYILIARAAIAVAGTATIVVLARLGSRVADHTTGLVAAFFLSVAVLHVRDSHFALTDVLMTLLVTTSLALLVQALETRSIRQVALAGPRRRAGEFHEIQRRGHRRCHGGRPVALAARWLAPRLHPDDTLHDAGGDYTRLDFGGTPFHGWRFDAATSSFGAAAGRTPDWIILDESPLSTYTSVSPQLLALVDRDYVLVQEVRGTRGGTRSAVYDSQDAFFLPVSGFSAIERPGPDVRIYRRR